MEASLQRTRWLWLNGSLFLVTLATTMAAGAQQTGVNVLAQPAGLVSGLPFALTLMTILLVHEMGHYLTARYHGVRASLPYFIPAPSFIGTFGAFIRMDSPPQDRRALFDVGVSGPLAGLILAIPALIFGLKLSSVSPAASIEEGITLGSSLLLSFLSWITLGFGPNEANIILHPVAFAGWIGLFVTAMNLLPVGQLDGGHVIYALFGRRHVWISRGALLLILALGLMGWWDGWLVWGVLLLVLGVRHPPPADPYTPLDFKRKLLGWFAIAVLALTFTPVPFSLPGSGALAQRLWG